MTLSRWMVYSMQGTWRNGKIWTICYELFCFSHMAEHMEVPIDTSNMSEQELQFHYFKGYNLHIK